MPRSLPLHKLEWLSSVIASDLYVQLLSVQLPSTHTCSSDTFASWTDDPYRKARRLSQAGSPIASTSASVNCAANHVHPYIPRARPGASATVPTPGNTNPLSPSGKPIPIITSSAQGGVTTRHPVPPPPLHPASTNGRTLDPPLKHGPSAALLEQVQALDNLPRLGALQMLDLKGNDIRIGIT